MKKNKILVTGGAGFIGSHLVGSLIDGGYEVYVVDDLSKGNLKNLNKGANFLKLSIEGKEFLKQIEKIKPHTIYHLAAQSSITESLKDPEKDFEINLFSTIDLLDKARKAKVRKVIFASSAAVFGRADKLPIEENYPKETISYYGLTKLCSEYFFKNYSRQYKLPYVCLRLANVYGPRQDAKGEGGVIAIFATNILRGKSLTIYGDGNQTRDFIYISDVVEAFIKSLGQPVIGEFNVGTSRETSINDLAESFIKINGQSIQKTYLRERFTEVKRSSLSSYKFHKATGYSPKVTLNEGLEKTLSYFKHI